MLSNHVENYQTRSEENGLEYFETLKEAIEYSKKDPTVWKISFWSASHERIRLLWIDGVFQLKQLQDEIDEDLGNLWGV